MNATQKKFGYPATLIKEYQKWVVVLRPQQVTLGSVVLICQETAGAFSQVSPEAFAELSSVIRDIEAGLSQAFSYNKINYLMLMMVDPDVHFHVIPRYQHQTSFRHQQFFDHGWPGPPSLKHPNETSQEINEEIVRHLKKNWDQSILGN
jgi:diadenosine tetraphosphate (Ap4A) HIT family hydrolase